MTTFLPTGPMSSEPVRQGILELLRQQRNGWSLEQQLYLSPDVFQAERRHLARQWHNLAHISELPLPGSHIVRDLLGESILIVRDKTGQVHGFYNVCRHRGSRICDHDGRSNLLTCPYHAWSYKLDGSLASAPAMQPDIDLGALGLKPILIRNIAGLIIGSLEGNTDRVDPLIAAAEELYDYHAVPTAKIAARRDYAIRANWKLAQENFLECYHCRPAHPEYCSVFRLGTSGSSDAWLEEQEAWEKHVADPASPARLLPMDAFGGDKTARRGPSRSPIGHGHLTVSEGGRPVAPLMGKVPKFDGAVARMDLSDGAGLVLMNDHAIMIQFQAIRHNLSHVRLTWLVDGHADADDIDVDRLIWLWDETTKEDVTIIERNARGVASTAYAPGPYSTQEQWTADFVEDYRRSMDSLLSDVAA